MADSRPEREVEGLNGWWHTWLDKAVEWERETLFPPGTPAVDLPARAPSAGWDGIEWGMESTRVPGTLAQARAGYHGVAWQWRPIVIPEAWRGRVVRLAFGGARQRAEVYLDDRPVGHDLDGLTPFAVDLSPHVRPGEQHELAVRLTNPGGWSAGEEGGALRWGGAALPGSRDVGGMWGGVALQALPPLHVVELAAFPGDTLGEVAVRIVLRNAGPAATARVRLNVVDAEGHSALEEPSGATVTIGEGEERDIAPGLAIAGPRGWSPQRPHLYRVVVEVLSDRGRDRLEAPLGLRRVVEGDGRLWLDGTVLGENLGVMDGAGPADGRDPSVSVASTPAEAEREVARARAAGLDGLISRGWPAAPELLEVADRVGLPVVQTLVGVEDPAGVPSGAGALYEALARDRLRRLIRRDRHHPSVVAWRLPMARGSDAYREYAGLVREEDPTRPVLPLDEPKIGRAR